MLSFCVKPGRGNKAAFKSIRNINKNTKKGINRGFIQERLPMKKATIDSMEEAKRGNDYWVYYNTSGQKLKRGRWHRASSKEETPAVLSGKLKRSLGFTIKYGKMLTYGANTPYARKHENSGRTYLGKTIRRKQTELGDRIGRNVCHCLNNQGAK